MTASFIQVIADAEEYYRKMFDRNVSTWNLRDEHMMSVLEEMRTHLSTDETPAKVCLKQLLRICVASVFNISLNS